MKVKPIAVDDLQTLFSVDVIVIRIIVERERSAR